LPRPGSAPTLAMALLLGTLSTVSPLSIDTFFPSIPAIAADFKLSAWQVQQIITSYMLPYALFTLVHGPLSDALGRRRLVVIGMLLYTLASLGCMVAPSFGVLLLCRVLQGTAAGIGPTIARAVVRDLYEGHNAQRLMSIMMMVFSVAPAIGPVIGGWLHVAFGWRSVFGFMVFMGLCLAAFAYVALPETHPPEKRSQFHLGQLARTSWGILCSADFMLLAVSAAMSVGAVMLFIGSAPAIVIDRWHLGETDYFYLFGPVVTGFMTSSFIASRLAGRVSRMAMLRFGYTLMTTATALLLLTQLLVTAVPLWPQQVLLFCMAFGAQFTFPILTLEMLDLQPRARGAAASVSTFVALGFGAVVMGVIAPLLGGSLWRIELAATLGGMIAFTLWRIARHRVASSAAHAH
jgi:DHA1 family bicyclomycin/chloramphenicol resistance-like MFS transporter